MFKNLIRKLTGQANKASIDTASSEASNFPPIPEIERRRILREATTALYAQQFDKVASLVSPLIQANQNDGDALALEGIRIYELKQYRMAANILYKAVSNGVQDPIAHKCLSLALFYAGDKDIALHYIEQALEKLPNDPYLLNAKGFCCIFIERGEEAADTLSEALELASADLIPNILCNIHVLECVLGVGLARKVLSPKGERIKAQALANIVALEKKGGWTEHDIQALLMLGAARLELSAVLQRAAEKLYSEPFIEDYSIEILSKYFASVGDFDKTYELSEQAASFSNGGIFYLGFLRIFKGNRKDWFEAWRLMQDGFAKTLAVRFAMPVPKWEGQSLKKKKLFIFQDQGVGDTLIALRFLKYLSKKQINAVMSVTPDLGELLRGTDIHMEVVNTKLRPDPRDLGCDYAIPIVSLLMPLKLWPEDVKEPLYLSAPQDRCLDWRNKLRAEKRLKVGIVASGNPWRVEDDWQRSVFPRDIEPFSQMKSICWVNLAVDQRPERDETIKLLGALDPTPDVSDFADTAAIISELDVVVTIDCAAAHLAASLGKTVFVLVPKMLDWRWQIGADTQPWWPNAKTFRSPAAGVWKEPVAAIVKELESELVRHAMGSSA